ncbi:MAG: hypothetical protein ACT4P7_11020 [Gemmatimonadaceae bacterium]
MTTRQSRGVIGVIALLTRFGTIDIVARDGSLAYRWGVLDGPTEVFDAEKDQLRIEIAGSGSVVSFRVEGAGPAKSLDLTGATFVRK